VAGAQGAQVLERRSGIALAGVFGGCEELVGCPAKRGDHHHRTSPIDGFGLDRRLTAGPDNRHQPPDGRLIGH
jgi:hypothetical protein